MQDNIRVFIEKSLDKEPRKMRSSLFIANFFPILGIVGGLILGGVYRVFSFLIALSIFISFILIVILTKNHKVIYTIKANMYFNMFTSGNYLIFAMILYSMYSKVHSSLILLFLPHVLVAILTMLFSVQSYKKKKSTSSKSKNVSIGAIVGATSVATYLMLKRLDINMEQNVALLIGTILLILISLLFVFIGFLNIMKLYYIKKYRITFEEDKGNTGD